MKCAVCGNSKPDSKWRYCCDNSIVNLSVILIPFRRAARDRAFRSFYMGNPQRAEKYLKEK